MKKAGILTIGDEILQGYTLNLNSQYISKELTIRNIDVSIHLTVPDKVSKIKEKINKFIIKDYDYIFITGGLGPTYDDVTKKALLELFDSKLIFLNAACSGNKDILVIPGCELISKKYILFSFSFNMKSTLDRVLHLNILWIFKANLRHFL